MTADSASRRSLTWRFAPASTVLNTTQFLAQRSNTDLARRKSGVQISSPPSPNTAGPTVVGFERAAVTAVGAALAANAPGRVFDVGLGVAVEAGRPSEQPFA